MSDPATLLNNTVGAYFIGCIISSMLRAAPKIAFLYITIFHQVSWVEDVTRHEDLLRNEAITPKSWKRTVVWALGGFIITVVQQSINNNIIVSDNENKCAGSYTERNR
ncbi:predicted protein [Postia placenta Mad-698-R]|uniref:Uncharacterized protein n=1 Tax=Postia placenta MAD-698-R-SB12 TaxID=670580 RepID=A0A1X6MRF1_9APHY|nr:hypothetical protein POSPLADRAFT_1049117 [Postia placenta MAD-698-R-SB12]EED80016.1 predicted protein [Postia placenta Mad-698-R]OSX58964.1 hypothetical protein POSPLADRAFT_1049117 [Postia placenta MAD-698-R-SB12]